MFAHSEVNAIENQAMEQLKRHRDLTNMLQEQNALGSAVIYDYVVQLNKERIRIEQGSRIDSFVKLEGGESLHIGRYVHIASFAHIGIGGGRTLIGDYAAVASGGKLISGSNQVDARSMSACAPQDMQNVKRSFVTLEQYSVVLANAVVLPGVTLKQGAVLAAGGVATKDIPAWEIWGGVPARFMRKREV